MKVFARSYTGLEKRDYVGDFVKADRGMCRAEGRVKSEDNDRRGKDVVGSTCLFDQGCLVSLVSQISMVRSYLAKVTGTDKVNWYGMANKQMDQ